MQSAEQPTEEASSKIKSWQEKEKDFLRQTGLKKQTSRSQTGVYSKREASKTNWEHRKEIEKYSKLHYNRDGTIIITDNWTDKDKPSIPSVYKPNAVIDTLSRKGKQHDRTIYDGNGRLKQQIHAGNHGNAKNHPYGQNGEHVHDYTWKAGSRTPEKTVREFNKEEYTMHKDLF